MNGLLEYVYFKSDELILKCISFNCSVTFLFYLVLINIIIWSSRMKLLCFYIFRWSSTKKKVTIAWFMIILSILFHRKTFQNTKFSWCLMILFQGFFLFLEWLESNFLFDTLVYCDKDIIFAKSLFFRRGYRLWEVEECESNKKVSFTIRQRLLNKTDIQGRWDDYSY